MTQVIFVEKLGTVITRYFGVEVSKKKDNDHELIQTNPTSKEKETHTQIDKH